ESRAIPSCSHGVTTIVTGNCGVGFAPTRGHDHDRLISLMAGVEDIPEIVMTAGLQWNWESFADYLKVVAGLPHDVDVACMVPHSALRVYVMGERAVAREDATPEDIAEMSRLVGEALRAGAIGFGTSRSLGQRAIDGVPIPTVRAQRDELVGIARALRQEGRGVFQLLSDFKGGFDEEFGLMRDIVRESGRPLSYTLHQKAHAPEAWRHLLEMTAEANREGLEIRGQVIGRPTGVLLGFELTTHPFVGCPSYQPIAGLPLDQRIAALRDPDLRRRLIDEEPMDRRAQGVALGRMFDRTFELGDPPNYEPDPSTSLKARAEALGVKPAEVAYDLMMGENGRAILFCAAQDYEYGDLEVSRQMMQHQNTILGLGDAGAHCGVVCDAGYPTHMLAYWGRDRTRGAKLPLPWIVKALTHDTAQAMRLTDRGQLKPGLRADVNLIDFDRLQLARPRVEYSLPAGGRRLVQDAAGYVATVKSGVVTYRGGEHTGALPGELVSAAA
ncbi:MAG: amidohydrolase family protein, partial [Phenylobacterium sp.]